MGSKARKEEYAEVLSRIFGVRIKWENLSLRDLELLADRLANHTDEICAKLCKAGSERLEILELLKGIIKAWPEEYSGPFIRTLKGILQDTEKAAEEGETEE